MKKAILFTAVLTALAAAGTTAAALEARTTLTITGKALNTKVVAVSGSLRSSAVACIRSRQIRLYLVQRPKKPLLLGKARTDVKGRYSFRVKTTRRVVVYTRFAGAFYSSYGGQQSCKASTSKKLAIAPRRR